MVEETFLPGNSVSRVARMHGVAPNQLFRAVFDHFGSYPQELK